MSRLHRQLKRPRRTSRWLLGTALVSVLALVGACGNSSDTSSKESAGGDETLKVVITSLPPYVTKGDNGHLEGIDGTLFDKAAKRLGLNYSVTVTNWDGMLAAVQSKRADLAVSDVAWTDAREKTGLFTDPAYYLSNLIAVKPGLNIHTVEDLSGHSVGAINGQSYIDPLNSVPGVHLRLYPDTASLLSDLSAGRIDVAIMDPLVMVYQQKVRPDLHYNVVPLTPPTMAQVRSHPDWALLGPQMIGWYARPGAHELVNKLNGVIHDFWKSGENAQVIKDAGVDATPFIDPGSEWLQSYEKQRRGVDRPDNWVAPSK